MAGQDVRHAEHLLGIDLGAAEVKIALCTPDGAALYQAHAPGRGHPLVSLLQILKDLPAEGGADECPPFVSCLTASMIRIVRVTGLQLPETARVSVSEEIHRITPEQAFESLASSSSGLTSEEARGRLQRYGPNKLPKLRKRSLIGSFIAQFTDFFAILLEVAAVITFVSYLIGRSRYDLRVTLAVLAVVLLNAIIGFAQEYRAERTAEALKELLPAKAEVLRGGMPIEIAAEDLVPGDLLVLEEGAHISADCRVVYATELATNDAALTGESEPVRRRADLVLEDVPRIRSRNLVFAGTSVASGSGRGVVYATGAATEFGRIYTLTAGVRDEPSPLQREVRTAARRVGVVALLLSAMLFALRLAAHATFIQAFLYALAVMVALVPEGLPAVMSVSLAVAVRRMAAARALVKRLASVETLGSTTVIATDKTGTLTAGEMTVRTLWAAGKEFTVTGVGYTPEGDILDGIFPVAGAEHAEALDELLRAALFCNNSKHLHNKERGWSILGDPTEGALLVLAAKARHDIESQLRSMPRVREIPFDSVRKRMTVAVQRGEELIAYTKGAPSEILSRSTRILDQSGERALTPADCLAINTEIDRLATQGFRVLGFAFRPVQPETPRDAENLERDLIFLGLAAMQDPPRPEATEAVAQARQAGIRVIMITGDYGLTAEAIARKVGIVGARHPQILTGADLEQLSEQALLGTLQAGLREGQDLLFARVAPADKLRLVAALKTLDEVVAVTGDGVNDAPALRRADIGIAMGRSGTDVAREAAVMVLLDDSFATIVRAIEQGRAAYKNIRKFLVYLFSHNLGELFPVIFATLTGLPVVPLNALQVLAIDLGSDVLPALALGTEAPERGLLREPPRSRKERLLSAEVFKRFLFLGSIQSIGATAAFFFALYMGGWHWGRPLNESMMAYRQAITMTQAGIVFSQFFNGFAVRTDRESVFAVGLLSNPFLALAEILGIVIMLGISYLQPLQSLFGTAALPWYYWFVPVGFGAALLVAEELRKGVIRQIGRSRTSWGRPCG
ncbi:MAG TPA: cation-transporting P-type ATPase [Bryobacteraceae bacterium]|nr:cation-transporting P-type ATPase [Bryobacteraceae bacterium]